MAKEIKRTTVLKEAKAAAIMLTLFGLAGLFYVGGWWALTHHERAVEWLGTLFVKLGICTAVFCSWGYGIGLRDARRGNCQGTALPNMCVPSIRSRRCEALKGAKRSEVECHSEYKSDHRVRRPTHSLDSTQHRSLEDLVFRTVFLTSCSQHCL